MALPSQRVVGDTQSCFGIYSGGNNGNGSGWLAAHDVIGKAKSCYFNYGFYNFDSGHAETYGGTYYGEGGNQSFGYVNKDNNTYHKAERCTGWAESGSTANVGYYNLNGANANVDGCSLRGNTYGLYHKDTGSLYAGLTKIEGGYRWPGSGTFQCYNVYNASTYTGLSCDAN